MKNKFVKNQFNKQARSFSEWSVTKNERYMQGFLDFTRPEKDDEMLDIACGSGDFSIFCAKKMNRVAGIDISDKEITIAKEKAREENLENVSFICSDVEKIPLENNSFSFVACKHSFHHFENPEKVFLEMTRLCKPGGKICIEDLSTYEPRKADDFFLDFDIKVDTSHLKTYSGKFFTELYKKYGIEIWRSYYLIEDLDFWDYASHGFHPENTRREIETMVKNGLKDPDIAQHLFYNHDRLFFKRPLFIITGFKK
jgi:ubiquinone/menaquinone biosynthesis C-methylase UbiE